VLSPKWHPALAWQTILSLPHLRLKLPPKRVSRHKLANNLVSNARKLRKTNPPLMLLRQRKSLAQRMLLLRWLREMIKPQNVVLTEDPQRKDLVPTLDLPLLQQQAEI
jgi:hypothetical protein